MGGFERGVSRQDLNTILAVTLPILFSALVGVIVWKYQSKETAKALAKLADEKEKREAIAKGHQTLLDRVTDLEKSGAEDSQSLALLRQEMLPMAEAMKRKLVEILTHPSPEFHPPDALLSLVKERGAELPPELVPYLKDRISSDNPHVTEQEKLAAEALPIITRLAQLEDIEAESAEITAVQLVSSTSKSPETKKREEGKS